ncbi:MAG: MmcQ/YjbR family DNA-binding protein [Crocinitomicaceae bacterium]
MNFETIHDLVLSLENTEQNPHFDRTAFKVKGKRIFASYDEKSNSVNIKLPLVDQVTFCSYKTGIFPVPNKFGEQGWTTFELNVIPTELVFEAMHTAYLDVISPKK